MRRTTRHVGGSVTNLVTHGLKQNTTADSFSMSAWTRLPLKVISEKERRRLHRRKAWLRQVDKHRKNIWWMKQHDEFWFWTRISKVENGYIASAFVKVRPGQRLPTISFERKENSPPSMNIGTTYDQGVYQVADVLLEEKALGQTVPGPYCTTHVITGKADP